MIGGLAEADEVKSVTQKNKEGNRMNVTENCKIELQKKIGDSVLLILKTPTSVKKKDLIDLKKINSSIQKIEMVVQHPQNDGLKDSVDWNAETLEITLGDPERTEQTLFIVGV